MERGGVSRAEPVSGGWQRCRPPFRVRALRPGPPAGRAPFIIDIRQAPRAAVPFAIYFCTCAVRHTIVKRDCLIPELRPGDVPDQEPILLSRQRPHGPAGNLSLPICIPVSSLKRCPDATGRLHARRVSALARQFREGKIMGLIITLIVGGIIGWLASIVMRTDAQQGIILNVVVGIVGAFLGNFLGSFFGMGASLDTFSPIGLLWAFIGAVVLLGIINLVRRGSVRCTGRRRGIIAA